MKGKNSNDYYVGDYAIVETRQMNLRNVSVVDSDLKYLDMIIDTLMKLLLDGVKVKPILGYSFDENSSDNSGYIIQERAKGEEVYDYAILLDFYVFSQTEEDRDKVASKKYLLNRTKTISEVPQEHYDKFMEDTISLLRNHMLVDFFGKSNFFYDENEGFQFIDIMSHDDFFYGLTDKEMKIENIVSLFGYLSCHLDETSGFLGHFGLSEKVLSRTFKVKS